MGRWISSLIVFVIALAPLCAQNPPAYSGEIVVKLKKGSTQFGPDQLAPLAIDAKVRPVRKVARDARTSSPSVLDGILKFRIAPGHNIRQVCDSLARLEGVLYAEPLFRESLLHQPDDPYAARGGQQSYLALIKAYEAWDVTKGSKEIVLGIIDTGADLEHQDLKGKFLVTRDSLNGLDDDGNGVTDDHMGYDFANNDPYPQADYDPHGTRVSGIAGAMTHNALGIAGVGYHTTLSALKIFTSESNESMGAYDAILYAADNGYDVINLSWGSTGSYSPYAQDVITYAVREKDVVVVAAAGNSSIDEAFYPAAYDDVLSVAATNSDDTKASFSTFHQSVDLVAPGSAIFTTTNGQSYTTGTGTSFAAPMVAGTAALVRARFPSLNARQVMERIRVTTDDISLLAANKTFEGKLGKGRLNAFRAVSDEQLISVRPQLVSVSGPFPEGL
ncbi:MAG: S8 family serine peptidase, partial [Cyclobacteriaceae bacterium]|nr:S8 family serine peptidase [Cyclobacteriaceae bacterium]